jgi:drug/metabolite transporter (DMT)-like permease
LIAYAGMQALGKDILSKDVPVTFIEFSLFRSLFLTITAYMMMNKAGRRANDVPADCVNPLIFRSLVGIATFLIVTISLKMLPISIYTIILSTSPFFVGVL